LPRCIEVRDLIGDLERPIARGRAAAALVVAHDAVGRQHLAERVEIVAHPRTAVEQDDGLAASCVVPCGQRRSGARDTEPFEPCHAPIVKPVKLGFPATDVRLPFDFRPAVLVNKSVRVWLNRFPAHRAKMNLWFSEEHEISPFCRTV
jgi:hypothetical protein